MKKNIFIAFGLIIASCAPSKMLSTPDVILEVKDNKVIQVTNFAKEINVSNTLKFLTSDELEGRDSGSQGIEKASVYLENLLKENGIKPYFKSYRDTLSNYDKTSYNIVGYIEGIDPVLKKEFVIVSAHYDHIGKISAINGDNIANGANDNAAGTTAVFEVAKYFAQNKTNKRSLLIVFFSAEEKGLLGSEHLAAKLNKANFNLYCMLNYEMIGVPMKNRPELLYITGFGKSNMANKINEYAGEKIIGFLQQELTYKLFMRSDNFSFLKNLIYLHKLFLRSILKITIIIIMLMMNLSRWIFLTCAT